MTYTSPQLLTLEDFVTQYRENPRYELADGELLDYARKVEEYALLDIPEYWIVDYRGLGGIAFIGRPKQPTVTVCQLIDEDYTKQLFRLGQLIISPILPSLQIRLKDILPR